MKLPIRALRRQRLEKMKTVLTDSSQLVAKCGSIDDPSHDDSTNSSSSNSCCRRPHFTDGQHDRRSNTATSPEMPEVSLGVNPNLPANAHRNDDRSSARVIHAETGCFEPRLERNSRHRKNTLCSRSTSTRLATSARMSFRRRTAPSESRTSLLGPTARLDVRDRWRVVARLFGFSMVGAKIEIPRWRYRGDDRTSFEESLGFAVREQVWMQKRCDDFRDRDPHVHEEQSLVPFMTPYPCCKRSTAPSLTAACEPRLHQLRSVRNPQGNRFNSCVDSLQQVFELPRRPRSTLASPASGPPFLRRR